MQMVFSKVHPACHSIVKVSNQEVTLKRLISMLSIAQKLYVGTQSDLCGLFKFFIQQCGQRYSSP